MKNFKIIAIFVCLALFSTVAQAVIVMQPLTTFGTNGDGSVRPGDLFFLTSSNQWQRGMAYNPATGHLLVVDRSTNTATSGNGDVYILDGNTGAHLGKLDISAIFDGGNSAFKMNLIGVADDGVIYVANLSSATTPPQYRLYRWANETSPQTLVYPTIDFQDADPSTGNTNATERRWGDTMAVRGSGLNTQILIGNRGTLAAVFTPDDGTFTHFTPKTLATDAQVGGLSVGLTFGTGTSFWTTSGGFGNGPLRLMEFNTNAGTASTSSVFPPTQFPGTISPILAIPSSNLLVGITMVPGPDVIRLYDVSDLEESGFVLQDRKSFVTNRPNNNFSGALALGTNGVLYALDSDNGIMAFTLTNVASNPLPPVFFLSPEDASVVAGTNNVTFTSGVDGSMPVASYQWFYSNTNSTNAISGAVNSSLTISNVQSANAGNYFVVASNSLGSATSSVAVLTVLLAPLENALVFEPFPYAIGSQLNGQNGWFSSTANNGFVTNGNLTVPGLKAPTENMLSIQSATISLRRDIGTNINSGSVYFSYALRIDNLGSPTANTIAGFTITDANTYFVTKINIRGNGAGGYNLGVFKGGTETAGAYAPHNLAVGETVFIVGRYTFVGGTVAQDDTCSLWINPDSSTFGASNAPPATVSDVFGTTADISAIARFFIRNVTAPVQSYVDEVRVGTSWADVTPVFVAPAVPPVLSVARNGSTNVDISWPTASTGFTLQSKTDFNSPTWVNVTNSVVVNGTNNTVTVGATSGNQFFRLKK